MHMVRMKSSTFSSPRQDHAYKRTGDRPHIQFRALSDSHVREHPLVVGLPHVDNAARASYAGLRTIRQHTHLWDALHSRRLTTSRLAGALGFYERFASAKLGVPHSLCGHGKAVSAWSHLYHDAANPAEAIVRDANNKAAGVSSAGSASMPSIISAGLESYASDVAVAHELSDGSPSGLWRLDRRALQHTGFLYRYCPAPPSSASLQSRAWVGPGEGTGGVRMQWGSEQENVGFLAACNSLVAPRVREAHKHRVAVQDNSRLLECGLCCAEAVPWEGPAIESAGLARTALPLFGASPDGVLLYDDGRVEALEVKCHSPFAYNGKVGGRGATYQVLDRGPTTSLGPWFMPQLQMEAFCLGPLCTGTNLVSLSATCGARIYWVQRDDIYIGRMLTFMSRFQTEFVDTGREPPTDYWCRDPAYLALLDHTNRMAAEARVRVHVPEPEVQRSPHGRHFFAEDWDGGAAGGGLDLEKGEQSVPETCGEEAEAGDSSSNEDENLLDRVLATLGIASVSIAAGMSGTGGGGATHSTPSQGEDGVRTGGATHSSGHQHETGTGRAMRGARKHRHVTLQRPGRSAEHEASPPVGAQPVEDQDFDPGLPSIRVSLRPSQVRTGSKRPNMPAGK